MSYFWTLKFCAWMPDGSACASVATSVHATSTCLIMADILLAEVNGPMTALSSVGPAQELLNGWGNGLDVDGLAHDGDRAEGLQFPFGCGRSGHDENGNGPKARDLPHARQDCNSVD